MTAPADAPPDVYDDEPADTSTPRDDTAERAVLGAILLSPAACDDVVAILSGPEFYQPANETVFAAVAALHAAGEPHDAVAVAAELTRRGDLRRVGGHSYLATCMGSVPTAANGGWYAHVVRDRWVERRALELATRIAQAGHSGAGADGTTAQVDAAVTDYLTGVPTDNRTASTIGDLVDPVIDRIENPEPGQMGLPTGYADVDGVIGGLLPGQFVILAGRPAMGKSVMGMDIARHVAAIPGKRSLFASLEMSRTELGQRLLAAEAGVSLSRIKAGGDEVDADMDWPRIARARGRMADYDMVIEEPASLTLAGFAAMIRQHRPDVAVVDYAQLMDVPQRGNQSRQDAVQALARGFKLLAKASGIPIVAISQLNRGSEDRTDKRPRLSDLRESGAWEQDADVVVLVHRPEAYDPDPSLAGEAWAIVAKNRNGPTRDVELLFQGHYTRFTNAAVGGP